MHFGSIANPLCVFTIPVNFAECNPFFIFYYIFVINRTRIITIPITKKICSKKYSKTSIPIFAKAFNTFFIFSASSISLLVIKYVCLITFPVALKISYLLPYDSTLSIYHAPLYPMVILLFFAPFIILSLMDNPSAIPYKNPAIKLSPAPKVSTTSQGSIP